MLAWIGKSSRKLFLHREGAAAGHWPQAISPGLHHGLISSFASLGMGLGGVQREGSASFKARLKNIFTSRGRHDGETMGRQGLIADDTIFLSTLARNRH